MCGGSEPQGEGGGMDRSEPQAGGLCTGEVSHGQVGGGGGKL